MSKKENTIYIIIVIILILLVGYFAYVRNGNGTSIVEVSNGSGDTSIASSTESDSDIGTEVLGEASYGSGPVVAPVASPVVSNVSVAPYKVPLILLADGGVKGKAVACGDSLVYVIVSGPKVLAVLNQTYKELFNMGEVVGMAGVSYRNSLALGDLNFVEAKIDNGVASVYLTGKLAESTCDNARQRVQIEGAALNFSVVKSVKTYLDGKAVVWPSK